MWKRVGAAGGEQRRGRVRFRGTFTQRERDRSAGLSGGGGTAAAGGSGGMLSASLKRLTKLKRGGSLKEF
ncbi:hypothetical protein KR044_000512 [Drosophila immigrans]|nr:hypothetical protein KR044_000512 [Drosophila immigrans]